MEEVKGSQGIKLFGKTIVLQLKDEPNVNSKNRENQSNIEVMKRPDKIIPCPRCKSMETKFCYFNNYNVNQPRHFCKGCQRYWTAGGALRNVPIGAGRRKSKPMGQIGFQSSGFRAEDCAMNADYGLAQFVGWNGMVGIEEWQLAAAAAPVGIGGGGGGFRHDDFPVKRRRTESTGQPC